MSTNSPLSLPEDFPILGSGADPASKITLSKLTGAFDAVHVITLYSPPDNRLTPAVITTLLDVLDVVDKHVPRSAVLVTTSAIGKFYSNGFNLELARATDGFFRDCWNKLQIRLLTFPIPTIALMNGHAVSRLSA